MSAVKKRILALAAVFAVLLTQMFPVGVFAAHTAPQTVRVGWYQSDKFQEGGEGEAKSGYCYDYLQNVADYTNWEFEYVYGDWAELFEKLQNGEIDLLAGVSETDERRETMLFPDTAMGTDRYYLYKHADDIEISVADIASLSGKTAGSVTGSRMTTFLEEWNEENNAGLTIVNYDSFEELEADFDSGRLDLLTQTINNVLEMDGISIVAKTGEEPFYLAVSNARPDLLRQLNSAVTTILAVDPYLLENLQYRNYGATLTSRTLTAEETAWIAENPVITMGYLENYLPYSDTGEDGCAAGLMTDVLDEIIAQLGLSGSLTVQYRGFADYNTMEAALKSGEIMAAFPVYGDRWDLDTEEINATEAVISGTETFFYNRDISFNPENVTRIAVNANNGMQIAYCKRTFPDAELVYYGTIGDCLDAALDGTVDGTVINTLRTQLVIGNREYSNLSYAHLNGEESRCFGVNEEQTELLLILNRGLKVIGENYGIDRSYKYMSGFYSYGAMDFLREHTLIIGAGFIVFILGAISGILRHLHVVKQSAAQTRAALEKAEQLNTELENRQAQLAQAKAEAEAASRAKTAFLFNMSHDIRTPMNAIIGYTELMERSSGDSEKCSAYLKKLRSSGEFLLSLINNVLEMARIDSGRLELNEVPCRTAELTAEVSAVYEDLMRTKQLAFTQTLDVKTPCILADPLKLNEILLNLVSNAYKYTPAGGSVTLSVTEQPCGIPGKTALRIVAADTGIGMSKEYLPSLFAEFSRERNTTEAKVQGTGLGMAIVKKLVDLMGGTIAVESEQGRGTTFTVDIPFTAAEEPAADAAAQTPQTDTASLRGRRILLAEDNDFNAEIAMELLEDAGLQVERAADGLICVDMLSKAAAGWYDLILMDIQMPNLDGYGATKRIRAMDDPVKAGIPIVAMTANAFEEDKRNALNAGMNAHLGKPIEIEKLTETLAQYLR